MPTQSKLVEALFLGYLLIWLSTGESNATSLAKYFSRYSLLRTVPTNQKQLEFLRQLETETAANGINFWQTAKFINDTCDMMVTEEMKRVLRSKLDFAIIIPDVEKVIREKTNKTRRRRLSHAYYKNIGSGLLNLGTYHSYDEMNSYMDWLVSAYPDIVTSHVIGYSHEGRAIRLLKIGNRNSNQPAIWIDAGIHAREWIAPSTALVIINELVEKSRNNNANQYYVDHLTWYILPLVNPDGYEYSRSSTHPQVRLWRKNRSAKACSRFSFYPCCLGVDLNRNFDFKWGKSGGSSNPCEDIYQGTFPSSEPEVVAIQRFVNAHRGKLKAFISFHSYSQMWMYPYGYSRRTYPADVQELRRVARRARDAISNSYGTIYEVGTGADLLYPASGGSEDWAKGVAGIKYSYLVELRPDKHSWEGFLLDESQIVPTGQEAWFGVQKVADAVLQNSVDIMHRSSYSSIDCEDKYAFCPYYAATGACRYWPTMQKLCKQSCGSC